MSEPAKADFRIATHKLGTYMAIVFGVLAVWRILIQASRPSSPARDLIYLIFAVISAGVLIYIGSSWRTDWCMSTELEPR